MHSAALIVSRIWAADDALPTVEMSGNAETCKAHVNLEFHTAEDHIRHLVVGTGMEASSVVLPCNNAARVLVVCHTSWATFAGDSLSIRANASARSSAPYPLSRLQQLFQRLELFRGRSCRFQRQPPKTHICLQLHAVLPAHTHCSSAENGELSENFNYNRAQRLLWSLLLKRGS